MEYNEAMEFIKSTAYMGSVLGLERLKNLMEYMGNPQKKLKFVHIAGTNGKGSTCTMTASILQEAGYKVGLFTSPFISCFEEQIVINGESISKSELCNIVEYIKEISNGIDEMPTEFELTVAIAMEYYMRCKCDIVVLEVGMGGEGDATNVIESPEVAAITHIAKDHCTYLGDNVEAIAKVKAGIIKKGCSVVSYIQEEKVNEVIEGICKSKGVKCYIPDFESIILKERGIMGQIFDYGKYKNIELKLIGEHQRYNCAIAIEIIERLREKGYKICDEYIYKGLSKAKVIARMEVLCTKPLFLLDGGHNVDCVKMAVKELNNYCSERKIIFIVGVMADKEYDVMFELLSPLAKEWVATVPDNERALGLEKLGHCLKKYGKEVVLCESVENAVNCALDRSESEDIICAIGSLYMAGDIRNEALKSLGLDKNIDNIL